MSSEMDLPEIRFSRKGPIKDQGAEIFMKIRPLRILWEAFKITAPSCTVVGYLDPNSQ